MAQNFDKITGEKLPNGDVSQFMTAMNKELSTVKEKGVEYGLTLADKAHFLGVARNLTSAIEYYVKLWSKEVAESGESFALADLGIIVSARKGATTSEISSDIFNALSLDEIKAVAKVTEKALKDAGKDELVSQYKVITGNRAPSVGYKSLV